MTHNNPHTYIHTDLQTADIHTDMKTGDVGTRLIASDPADTTTNPTNNRIDIANASCINDADAQRNKTTGDVGTRLIASDPTDTTIMLANNRIDIANASCINDADTQRNKTTGDVGTRLIASDPDGTTTNPTNNRIDIANASCINDADAINRVPTSHNWPYKRFSDVMNTITPISKIDKSNYMVDGQYPIISQEETFISGYWNDPKDLTPHSSPVVIFGDHSRIIKYVDFEFVVGADGVKIIQPSSDLNAKFLYHYLNWYKIPALGYARHFKLIKEALFPVPPMGVQERIVAELDRINRVIEDCRELLRNLDSLAQSLFYDTFGDPVTNPKGWDEAQLGNYVQLKNGLNFTPIDNGIQIKCLNVSDFKDRRYILGTQLSSISISDAVSKEYLLRDDDIIFVRSNGNKKLVGRSILYKADSEEATFSGFCIRCRCQNKQITPMFLSYLLSTSPIRSLITKNGKGTNISNLNQRIINELPLILPPLPLQQEFAERVEEIEGQKMAVEETIKNMQTLLDSRMDFWFN